MRDDRLWRFLEIIRRKHVAFRRNEPFKEAPCAPGHEPQLLRICLRKRHLAFIGRWEACNQRHYGR